LLLARMSANSTALVDKQLPGYSTKLERVGELIETLCAEPARKIILFSEWTSMLDLIEPLLKRAQADAIALAQRKRRVSEAGGQLLAAAFSFLGGILPEGGSKAPAPQAVAALRAGLAECVETAEDGKLRLAVTLPGMQSLDALAAALAKLMAARESVSAGGAGTD
jgi:hypothetical protein